MNAHAPQRTEFLRDDAPGRKVVHACTTAAAIRLHSVEPAVELAEIERQKRLLLIELCRLSHRSEELACEIAEFTNGCAERLDEGERAGCFQTVPGVVSEVPSMRRVAARAREAIDTLAASKRRREHPGARRDLAALFETLPDLLTNDAFLYELGQKRRLPLIAAHQAWKAGKA